VSRGGFTGKPLSVGEATRIERERLLPLAAEL